MGIHLEQVTRVGDKLVLTVLTDALPPIGSLDGPVEHSIVLHLAALVDRMLNYGLEDETQAFEAILREHYKRLNELPDGEEEALPGAQGTLAKIRFLGGTRAGIDVSYSEEALAAMALEGL